MKILKPNLLLFSAKRSNLSTQASASSAAESIELNDSIDEDEPEPLNNSTVSPQQGEKTHSTRDESTEEFQSPSEKKMKTHFGKCVSCQKSSVVHYAESEHVFVKITREQFLDGVIELVTKNGKPTSIFLDSGMKKMIQPLMQAFKPPVSLHHENVTKLIKSEAVAVKKEISELFKYKMISLKIDIVTRLERGFLGINAQSAQNGKIILRCLGCVILTEKHSSVYITDEIKKVLENFGLGLQQIYSITYDNGRNMVKTGEILSEDATECLMKDITDPDLEYINLGDDGLLPDTLNDARYDLDRELKDALKELATLTAFLDNAQLGVNDLRCVAHTLQLVLDDMLKENSDTEYCELASLIFKVRALIKLLRTSTMRNEIQKYKSSLGKKIRMPCIDVITRWMTIYDMFESCLEYREFCSNPKYFGTSSENEALKLLDSEYDEIIEILATLKPLKIATLVFQKEQLTIPCTVIAWENCKSALKTMDTTYSKQLIAAMVKRESKIFSTRAIQCALYLDPRLQVLIPDENLTEVKEQLLFLGNRSQILKLQSLAAEQSEKRTGPQMEAAKESNRSDSEGILSDLQKRVKALKKIKQAKMSAKKVESNRFRSKDIEEAIENFEGYDSDFPFESNILEFWEKKKSTMPILYELACVVLATPPTQVSVERLFSGLKYILNPLRNNLMANSVDNIMLVKTNKIFSEKS